MALDESQNLTESSNEPSNLGIVRVGRFATSNVIERSLLIPAETDCEFWDGDLLVDAVGLTSVTTDRHLCINSIIFTTISKYTPSNSSRS